MSFFTFLSEFLSGNPDSAAQAARLRPRVGAVYLRKGGPGGGAAPVEYAEVTGLRSDEGGIRHVRFQLTLGYRDKVVTAGERTLSVECFTKRFPERFEPRSGDAVQADEGTAQTNEGAERAAREDTTLAQARHA